MDSNKFLDHVLAMPILKEELKKHFRDEWQVNLVQDIFKVTLKEALGISKSTNKNGSQQQDDKSSRYSREALDKELQESIKNTRVTQSRQLRWTDVAGLQTAKRELQFAVEMPLKQPQLFTGKLKPSKSILFYGPPGTGKTHLARVLASVANHTLYIFSASDTMNMWVGNSARLVRLMFQQARATKPAIIFFDEIDAICGDRSFSHTESHSEQKSELLVQMDGAKEDNSGTLFIGATNLPWNLDPAFLRRFEKKIYTALPDPPARMELLKIEFGDELPRDLDDWPSQYNEALKGFSGSDIKRLVQETLQIPIKEIQYATHFLKRPDESYVPCDPTTTGAMRMNWRQVPNGSIPSRPIDLLDFQTALALKNVKPSNERGNLGQYEEWTKKHGLN